MPYLHAAQRLHQLIREFPRFNTFAAHAYDTPITPSEAHFLIELAASPQLSASGLAKILGIDKALLSGVQAGLIRKGLLDASPSLEDARKKRLRLTSAGKAVLRAVDEASDSRLQKFAGIAGMRERDQRHLDAFLNALADGLRAPPSCRRSSEHLLRAVVRRLTRSFGMLGQNVLGTGLSTFQWQVLLHLNRADHADVKTLSAIFGSPWSSVSQVLSVLASKNLVRRSKSKTDRRGTRSEIGAKGLALIDSVQSSQSSVFASVLEEFQDGARRRGLTLVENFMSAAAFHHYFPEQEFQVRRALADAELNNLRKLQIGSWAHCPPPAYPPCLFSPDNECWGVWQSGRPAGGCELLAREGELVLVNVFCCNSSDPLGMEDALAGFAARQRRSLLPLVPHAVLHGRAASPLWPAAG